MYLVMSDFDFDDDQKVFDQFITKRSGVIIAKIPNYAFLMYEHPSGRLSWAVKSKTVHNFLDGESVDIDDLQEAIEALRYEKKNKIPMPTTPIETLLLKYREPNVMHSLTDNITHQLPAIPFPGLSRITVTVESIDEPGTTYEVIMYEGIDGDIVYIPEDGDEPHLFHRESMQWLGTDRIVSID